MDMNLQKYFAFVKTVEYGSFTRAARILNYTQSGVSRMIADLEKDLGVALLARGKSGVRLTSDGLRLLPYARSLCNGFERLRNEVDELNSLRSGLIRIGTFSSVATFWLPTIIKEFQKAFPNIDYELLSGDYTEIEEWIHTGRVDCGFLRLPTHPEFETIFLEKDRLLAIIPADHPLKDCERFPAEALCREPFMLLEKGDNAEISHFFAQNGLTPDVKFTTWDDYAIMAMVESGLGIALLPELILQRVPYRILTKELDVPAFRNIGLALRSREDASPAVRHFIDYLPYRNSAFA